MVEAFDLDDGAAARAAFGLVVLQNDETVEPELQPLFDAPGVALYHARIPSGADVTPESLREMEAELPHTAALLPTARPLDVIAYACTSGATMIGSDQVGALVRRAHPHTRVTDPLAAVIAACRHLGVARLGFVTPYVAEVSAAMRRKLEQAGLAINTFASFEQSAERVVARIVEQSVYDASVSVGSDQAVDAVFVSCTNLRSFGVVADAEEALGKPVISSNSALAWHMFCLAGLTAPSRGPGVLFGRDGQVGKEEAGNQRG